MPQAQHNNTAAAAPLPTMPGAGGSYTRQADGTLVKDEAAPVIATTSATGPATAQPQE